MQNDLNKWGHVHKESLKRAASDDLYIVMKDMVRIRFRSHVFVS